MTTQEAIVAVLVGAIFANLALAIGLIVGPRIRSRRDAAEAAKARVTAPTPPTDRPRAITNERPIPRLVRTDGWAPETHGGGRAAGPGKAGSADALATDPVTGFALAPAWSRWLAEEGARLARYGRPATIVIVELAGIERLAERLGSDAADRLIPPIATTMRRHARASDNLARLGPARFGALLVETDEVRAINYVERVRSACDLWLDAGAVSLRLSIGWAEIGANQPVEVAVVAAEGRLNEDRQRARARADLDSDAEPDVQASVLRPAST